VCWHLTDVQPDILQRKATEINTEAVTILNRIQTLQRVTLWVASTYFHSLPDELLSESIAKFWGQWVRLESRGKVEVARVIKLQRLAVTKYLAGEGLSLPGIRQDKVHLPVVLPRGLRDLIEIGDPWAIRWSLTLLSISRVLLGGKAVDFSTIEKPTTGNHLTISDYEIVSFHKSIGRPKLDYLWEKYHWSTKAGPNGPGLQGALADLIGIKDSPILDSLRTFYPADAPIWRLLNVISTPLYQLTLSYFKVSYKRLRKLSVKEDKETKSRIFAILDYWSQSALRTLHKQLYQQLKRLPGDCTFNQTRLNSSFAKDLSRSSKFYSFDLSAATDRFPVEIQQRLLSLLTSPEVAESWRQIMVSEEFYHKGRSYKYSCGQPMGAYSSWALFALCHHMVVHVAGLRAGLTAKQTKHCYMLLGDDIVIHHDEVACHYRDIIHSLGVEISEVKTHISKDSFEFAKRWFSRGVEVSPFPIAGVFETMKSWPLLVELLSHEVPSRGYESVLDLSTRLDSLIQVFDHKRLGQQVLKRLKIYTLLPCWYSDESKAVDALRRWHSLVKSAMPFFPDKILRTATLAAQTIVRKEVGSGIKRIQTEYFDLFQKVYKFEIAGSNHLPSSSTTLIPWDIPMIALVKDITERGHQGLVRGSGEPHWLDFWESWRSLDLMTVPKFNGIIPLRAHESRTSSQAHLALIVSDALSKKTEETIFEEWEKESKPVRKKGRLARMKEQGILQS